VLIGIVLVTMVGNTAHVLQVVGWLPITPISGVYLPYALGRWLGIFATWQGIGLQVAAAAFVLGSYFLAERMSQRKRAQAATRRTVQTQQVAAQAE
jgi:high-affinity iron transporter